MDIQTRQDRWIYGTAIIALALETAWGLVWAIPDILWRLGLWPAAWDFGLTQLLPTLSFTQEAVFFTAVTLEALALLLLVRKSAWALPVFVIAFLFDKTDWILMSLNPLDGTLIAGKQMRDFFFLVTQMIAIMSMIILVQRRLLSWAKPWGSGRPTGTPK